MICCGIIMGVSRLRYMKILLTIHDLSTFRYSRHYILSENLVSWLRVLTTVKSAIIN